MDSVPNTVILSGVSGMMGSALLQSLAARHTSTLQLIRKAPVTPKQIQWNPTGNPIIAEVDRLNGCAAAIHLSGANLAAHRWTARYRKEIAASRVESTGNLARTLAALPRPPENLLVASAVGFYGNRGDDLLTETSSAGSGFLADLCQQWEAAAEPAKIAGIRVVHLRFGVVLGKDDGALKRMLPPFRLGLGGKLGSGNQWMSWISLADLISALLFVLEAKSISGPVNLTAPDSVTNARFTEELGRQLHRPALFTVPSFALRLAFGAMADEALLSSARVLPAKLQAAQFKFAHPTIEQALAAALS
jgi:uncharacterized protein